MVGEHIEYYICSICISSYIWCDMDILCVITNTRMSRHNKFLEEHGCLTVLILAAIIIILLISAYHWARHGCPMLGPWIIKK